MAVKIRLARHGSKKRPAYRIVAADSRDKRDGRFLEILGTYNPMTNPPAIAFKEDRYEYWTGVGAQVSDTVSSLWKHRNDEPVEVVVEEAAPTKVEAPKAEKKVEKKAEAKAEPEKSEEPKEEAKPEETQAEEKPAE